MGLIAHTTLTEASEITRSSLVEYATAGNGLFVRARRDVCEVTIPLAEARVPGLIDLEPGLSMLVPRPARAFVDRVFDAARSACVDRQSAVEYLAYLAWDGETWDYFEPEQLATATSVVPVAGGLAAHARATIEIHSHHEMRAAFSATDDLDESTGFRIYGVVGRIFSKPEIALRVGCHGHFLPVALEEVFQ